jgi:hypothetical protein
VASDSALVEVEEATLAGAVAASSVLAGKYDSTLSTGATPFLGGTVSVSGIALVDSAAADAPLGATPLGPTSPLGAFVIKLGRPRSVTGIALGGLAVDNDILGELLGPAARSVLLNGGCLETGVAFGF